MQKQGQQHSVPFKPAGAPAGGLSPTHPALGSSALALAVAVTAPTAFGDESSIATAQGNAIEIVEVYGDANAPYKALRSGDSRRLADLAATPVTMDILTQTQIQDSGKSDLKEIVSAQAGVTLGTGENGNAFGDRYIIRGQEARSDVFVDGLRDPGMTTRESFATEQIEITKGPSGTFAGRGSSGGAVNSVTKQASPEYDFGIVDAGFGTDDFYRIVLDTNMAISDTSAVRINALKADETVPNRDGIERSREGLLLAGYTRPTDQLTFIADAYYLSADDVPDLGSFFLRDERRPYRNIPVYAQSNDFLDSEVLSLTLRSEYEVSDTLRLTGALRWGQTENEYIATGARGTTRDASDPVAPGADTISLSTHQGWQEVDYQAAQFLAHWDTTLAGLDTRWVFGIEYMNETVDNGVFDITTNGESNCIVGGRRGASAGYCVLDGEGNEVPEIRNLMQRSFLRAGLDAQFEVETVSAYFMDTIELSDKWQLFLGMRLDDYDYSNATSGRGGDQTYQFSDTLTSGNIGLVYAFSDEGNVYLNLSTANNINGGESDLGANCGYGGLCGDPDQARLADPERSDNIELGTKWRLFDDRLLATAALFQITKSDVMESVGDDYSTLGTLNTGENRVQGVEFSLSGAITDKLSVQMSAALMDSEVRESFVEENVGLALSNFADESLYLQLRYQPTAKLAFGGSYTYQGEMYGGQPDTAAGYDQEAGQYSIVVPSYGVFDLFANYYATEKLNFRLNVGNVTDKEYWTAAYRSGSFMYLGDARSLRASVVLEF